MTFGPLGRLVGAALKARGYKISRPTALERKYLRSPWQLFRSDVDRFAAVYRSNRNTLRSIPQWIDRAAMDQSLWNYGVPLEWVKTQHQADRTGVNDIEDDITTADVIGFLAAGMKPLSYLEIGVSVGKTLTQIAKANPGSQLVGLDIEEINPVLKSQFDTSQVEWRGPEGSPANALDGRIILKYPTMTRLHDKTAKVSLDYLSADQFRPQTWENLSGRKFNLIYSDGVHTPEALRTELSYLNRFDLIDRRRPFAMVWDDMWSMTMQQPFVENCRALFEIFGGDEQAISLIELHGSYGMRHPVGLFYVR